MTYDLRRLRLHGLIERVPRSHRYRITATGAQVAMFYARLYTRRSAPPARSRYQDHPAPSAPSIVSTPRSSIFVRRSHLPPEELDSNSHTSLAQDC